MVKGCGKTPSTNPLQFIIFHRTAAYGESRLFSVAEMVEYNSVVEITFHLYAHDE